MISNCRNRLETTLAALEAAVVGHHYFFYTCFKHACVYNLSLSGLIF